MFFDTMHIEDIPIDRNIYTGWISGEVDDFNRNEENIKNWSVPKFTLIDSYLPQKKVYKSDKLLCSDSEFIFLAHLDKIGYDPEQIKKIEAEYGLNFKIPKKGGFTTIYGIGNNEDLLKLSFLEFYIQLNLKDYSDELDHESKLNHMHHMYQQAQKYHELYWD